MIEQLYLTYRSAPNRYSHQIQSEPGSNDNEGVLQIFPKILEWILTFRWSLVASLGYSLREDFLCFQRFSWNIMLPKPTEYIPDFNFSKSILKKNWNICQSKSNYTLIQNSVS